MATDKLTHEMFGRLIAAGASSLEAKCEEVNNLNVFPVPDGDTGDNMLLTVKGGAKAVGGSTLPEISKSVSEGMLLGARGNSGVILSQFFAGIAEGLLDTEHADVEDVKKAFSKGVEKAYSAVFNPTEGTILTVMREGVEKANSVQCDDMESYFEAMYRAMTESLENTPNLLPVLKEAGVVDSGGAGILYIIEGFVRALGGEEIVPPAADGAGSADSQGEINLDAFGPDDEMVYGYCTELMLRLQNRKTDIDSFDTSVITDYLKTVGDSIVSFKTGSIVKIHVHTLTPEKVLAFCRQFGEFLKVKIENMSVQHNETKDAKEPPETKEGKKERTRYGAVAVSNGAGISKIFRDLGVDVIVDGGQTDNPSTSDFLEAFDRANADFIYVFPNNSNIILAASQAAEIYKDSKVFVVPSKNLGQGYIALSGFDRTSEDPESLFSLLSSSMDDVVTASVTTSVRDTLLDGIDIKAGDFIGFSGKTMLSSNRNLFLAVKEMLDRLITEDSFMITMFTGEGSDEDMTQKIIDYIEEEYTGMEVYPAPGLQKLYPYIFIIE